MSTRSLQRACYEIMVDNGMNEAEANDTVDNMSTEELETLILDSSSE